MDVVISFALDFADYIDFTDFALETPNKYKVVSLCYA